MIAISKFDVTRGVKFSTYATRWIRHTISKFIYESRVIKFPADLINDFRKINEFEEDYYIRFHKSPSLKDISDNTSLSIRRIKSVKNNYYKIYNLDVPLFNDSIETIKDIIEDESIDYENETTNDMLFESLRTIVEECKLTEFEREILYLRFGFYGNKPHTLSEIADKYGYTRQGINCIEKRILKKIRKDLRTKHLVSFFDNPEEILENYHKRK